MFKWISKVLDEYPVGVAFCVSLLILFTGYVTKTFLFDIWFDEAFSVLYSQHSFLYILQPHDVHPPIYYLTLKVWMWLFSSSEVYIRLLSFVFGVGSLIYLDKLLNVLGFGDRQRAASLMMYAFASTTVHYFTEVRMYAMAIFLAITSTYYLVKYFNDVEQSKDLWTYVALAGIMMFTHYYTFFFLGMQALYVLIFHKKSWKVPFKYEVGALLTIIGLGILVFTYFLFQKARIIGMWFPDSNWFSLLSTFHYYFFHPNTGAVPGIESWVGIAFTLFILGSCVWYSFRKGEKYLWLLLVVIIPPFIGMVINLFVFKVYHHRFFLFGAWAIFALIGSMMEDRSLNKLFRIVLTITMMCFLLFHFVAWASTPNTELKEASMVIGENWCTEDLPVLHESMFSGLPLEYYLQGCNLENYIYADFPVKGLNSGGGDAIDHKFIFRNPDVLQFEPEFIYIRHDGYFLNEDLWNCTNYYDKGGVFVDYCSRTNKLEGIQMQWKDRDYLIPDCCYPEECGIKNPDTCNCVYMVDCWREEKYEETNDNQI